MSEGSVIVSREGAGLQLETAHLDERMAAIVVGKYVDGYSVSITL